MAYGLGVGNPEPPSIIEQAFVAKGQGLRFIVITDHEEMFYNDNLESTLIGHVDFEKGDFTWQEMQRRCREAEEETGILVIPGEEVGSVIPAVSDGHLLAYNISSFVFVGAYGPEIEINGQDMINRASSVVPEIIGIPPLLFIAHPKGSWWEPDFPWEGELKDFISYHGVELFNSGKFTQVTSEWDKLLKQGRKVVGIGNSDAHWDGRPGHEDEYPGLSRTYLYIPGEVTHEAVFRALYNGQAV
ncbi:hypothetical protein L6259_03765, partial [Candidatus Parcubacteria bacterium]|nr:hypothetical protein [Candidatus Parcubacteria bacterium]